MVKLEIATEKEYGKLKKLYRASFPKTERAPFSMLVRKSNNDAGDFLCVYDDDVFAGMVYMVVDEKVAYVFYFAIAEELRGRGYGKETVRLLLERYNGKRFFLALEDVNDENASNREQRLKRHKFYEDCGLVDLPGKIKEGPVTFVIMGKGGEIYPEEYKEVITAWCGRFYRTLFGMKIILD